MSTTSDIPAPMNNSWPVYDMVKWIAENHPDIFLDHLPKDVLQKTIDFVKNEMQKSAQKDQKKSATLRDVLGLKQKDEVVPVINFRNNGRIERTDLCFVTLNNKVHCKVCGNGYQTVHSARLHFRRKHPNGPGKSVSPHTSIPPISISNSPSPDIGLMGKLDEQMEVVYNGPDFYVMAPRTSTPSTSSENGSTTPETSVNIGSCELMSSPQ